MDWYRSKRAIVARLDGLVDRLARAGISPDAVTLSAIPIAIAGGLALLFSQAVPALLALVPVLIAVRLILNLVDGALARATGRTHPRGELFNELGDRLADIAFLVPVAFLTGAQRETVLLGVTGAVLASFVGVTARAAGAPRLYGGILSKPGRMVLLAGFAVGALVLGPSAWGPFGPILLVGTVLTVIERSAVAIRGLP
ncbi:MAG TPA: CDP-alcohol phosphatidyltransferase family protein [Candidatus Limnocylindrales bacterium]|jgi:CDP-diacylglycerol--glycerol-3-phosphate 3-phosphatidyltransferase